MNETLVLKFLALYMYASIWTVLAISAFGNPACPNVPECHSVLTDGST